MMKTLFSALILMLATQAGADDHYQANGSEPDQYPGEAAAVANDNEENEPSDGYAEEPVVIPEAGQNDNDGADSDRESGDNVNADIGTDSRDEEYEQESGTEEYTEEREGL